MKKSTAWCYAWNRVVYLLVKGDIKCNVAKQAGISAEWRLDTFSLHQEKKFKNATKINPV